MKAKLRAVRNPAGMPPPSDLELERFVIGAALYLGAWDDARQLVRAEAFYSDPHRAIWTAAAAVAKRGDDPSFVLVAAQLRAEERMRPDVAEALEESSRAARLDVSVHEAATLVAFRGVRREFIAACQRIAAEGYGPIADDAEWLAEKLAELSAVSARGRRTAGADFRSLLDADLAEARGGAGATLAMATGFPGLDAHTAGLHAGETSLLSGRTGLGKSAFAGCVALNVAWSGAGIVWVQLEPSDCVRRFAIQQGRLDASLFRERRWTEQDLTNLAVASDAIRGLPIVVHNARRPSIAQLESYLATMVPRARELGDGRVLVVIDYLQLINGRPDVGERASREEAVGEVGRRLVEFAEKERVAMLAICQTNGEGEIRESRAVLQHAHNWWSLVGEKSTDETAETSARIEIRKQRNGPWPRRAPLWFQARSVLFTDGS